MKKPIILISLVSLAVLIGGGIYFNSPPEKNDSEKMLSVAPKVVSKPVIKDMTPPEPDDSELVGNEAASGESMEANVPVNKPVVTEVVTPAVKSSPPNRLSQLIPNLPPIEFTDEDRQAFERIPQMKPYLEFQHYQEQIGAYVKNSENLPGEEREKLVIAYNKLIEQYISEKRLIAAEGVLMKIGLIKTLDLPEKDQKALAEDIVLASKIEAEQNRLKFAEQVANDPKRKLLDERVAELKARVGGMSHFPGGVSKSAYLKNELQKIREEVSR